MWFQTLNRRRRGARLRQPLTALGITVAVVAGIALAVKTGGVDSLAGSMTHPAGGVVGAVSLTAVSNRTEKLIANALQAAVPQLDELYIQKLKDHGLEIVGTGSLSGYSDGYAVAASVSSRFLWAAYNELPTLLNGRRIDYAALYLRASGRYVMAAGLGRQAAKRIAIATFAPEQGVTLVKDLAKVDRFSGFVEGEAFAQYQDP